MKIIDDIIQFRDYLIEVKKEYKEQKILKVSDLEVTIPIQNQQEISGFFENIHVYTNIRIIHFENCIFNEFIASIDEVCICEFIFEKCFFQKDFNLYFYLYNRKIWIIKCSFINILISGQVKDENLRLIIDESNINDLSIEDISTYSIKLKNNTFKNDLILKSLKSNNIILERCSFNYNLNIEDIKVNKLTLIECIANKEEATFILSNIEGKIEVSDSKFESIADFSNNTFNENFYIKSDFRKLLLLYSRFNKRLYIKKGSKLERVVFEDSYFNDELIIMEANLGEINFSNSHFNDKLNIVESNLGVIDFSNSHFNNKLNIVGSNLGKIDFSNCHFKDTAKITLNKYNDNFTLDYSFSIFKSLFIIDSDFGNEEGDIINLNKEISFERSLISKDALILIRNVNSEDKYKEYKGTINFNSANILGTISLQNIKVETINLENSTITGNINFEDVDFKVGKRKTFLKIKNELLKQNNNIDALEYKSKELNHYLKELAFSNKYIDKWIKYLNSKCNTWIMDVILMVIGVIFLPILLIVAIFSKNLREVILLFINKISNNFGQSWVKGVSFTLFIWIFYFSLYKIMGCYHILDMKYLNQTLGEALSYFWLFGGLDELKTNNSIIITWREFVPFILGKIFIAFGIYQTIAAFRKYGSK